MPARSTAQFWQDTLRRHIEAFHIQQKLREKAAAETTVDESEDNYSADNNNNNNNNATTTTASLAKVEEGQEKEQEQEQQEEQDKETVLHPDLIKSAVLRSYFHKLTRQFLQPLIEFFQDDPGQRMHYLHPNPYLACMPPPSFSQRVFLAQFSNGLPKKLTSFPIKTTVSKVKTMQGLYKRFMLSPNFIPWFQQIVSDANLRVTTRFHSRLRAFLHAKQQPPGEALRVFMRPPVGLSELEKMFASCKFHCEQLKQQPQTSYYSALWDKKQLLQMATEHKLAIKTCLDIQRAAASS
jgi:hypothetical protein